MAHQRAMPLRDRYKERISEASEKKDEDIDAVRERRLEEAKSLGKLALHSAEKKSSSRTPRNLQRIYDGDKRPPSEQRTGSAKPGPGGSVPPPTPPRSPATSTVSLGSSVAITPMVKIIDSQEVADIRIFLRDIESEILLIRSQLQSTQTEVQDLHKQCQKVSKDYVHAVCRDDDENIKKFQEREEKLKRLLEQKNQEIKGLQDEIVERKRCEGELKEKLAEVEGRDKAREAMPTETEETVRDGYYKTEKCNKKGKDKPVRGKERAIGKADWEFRRRKGTPITALSAGIQLLQG